MFKYSLALKIFFSIYCIFSYRDKLLQLTRMRKFISPSKQGLVVCSIRAQTQGNSVYSFPHIFISQKNLNSLKLKWGQSIILSTGRSKDIKTCKAFVFVEDQLGQKQTVASQGVCKELQINKKDHIQIQCWNPKSPQALKLRRKASPPNIAALSQGLKQSNEFYVFTKDYENQLIISLTQQRLQIQVKCFREMKVYSNEFQDKIENFSVEDIFKTFKEHKKYQYNNQKKILAVNLNQKIIQLKLKKCPNAFRLIDNQTIFNAIDKINERLKKIQSQKRNEGEKNSQINQNNSLSTQESEKNKQLQILTSQNISQQLKKQKKKKDRISRLNEDLEFNRQLAKVRRKLQSMDFKVDELFIEKDFTIQNFKKQQFDKKFEKILENIDSLSEEIHNISHKTMYSYLLQKQEAEELKLRIQLLENQPIKKEKVNDVQNLIREEVRKVIDGLNQHKKEVESQKKFITIPQQFKKQQLKISFASKYIDEYLIEGRKILRMGSKGWTQLLTANRVPDQGKVQYQIKILQSKFNFVMFGIISEDLQEEKSSWTSQNCYAYFGWNGNIYMEGQCVLKQGRGFKHGQTVGLQINMKEGIISWTVNNQVVFEYKKKKIKDSVKKWLPYIQMFSPGDQIQFLPHSTEKL